MGHLQIPQAAQESRAISHVTAATILPNQLIEGPGGPGSPNTSADLLDYSSLDFADLKVWINGRLMRPGTGPGSDFDIYPSTVPAEQAVGAFYCEFPLLADDVVQMIVGSAGPAPAPSGSAQSDIYATSQFTITPGNWYSWGFAFGWNTETWSSAYGSNAGAPTLNRFQNGWPITRDANVVKAKIMLTQSGAFALDYVFELWKIAQTDGDTVDGAKTKVASVSFTTTALSNSLVVKDMVLDAPSLAENDMLVMYGTRTDAAGAVSARFTTAIEVEKV